MFTKESLIKNLNGADADAQNLSRFLREIITEVQENARDAGGWKAEIKQLKEHNLVLENKVTKLQDQNAIKNEIIDNNDKRIALYEERVKRMASEIADLKAQFKMSVPRKGPIWTHDCTNSGCCTYVGTVCADGKIGDVYRYGKNKEGVITRLSSEGHDYLCVPALEYLKREPSNLDKAVLALIESSPTPVDPAPLTTHYVAYFSNIHNYWYVDLRDEDGGNTVLTGFKTAEAAEDAADYLNGL